MLGTDFYQQVDVAAGVVGVLTVVRGPNVVRGPTVVRGLWVLTVTIALAVIFAMTVACDLLMRIALRVVDLKVRIPVIMRADDPVVRHRQHDSQQATQPQQQSPRNVGQLVRVGNALHDWDCGDSDRSGQGPGAPMLSTIGRVGGEAACDKILAHSV